MSAKASTGSGHFVSDDRFKVLDVKSRISIKDFVSKEGITFAKGKGYYLLNKPETIQVYKEIVAVRKSDGAKVTGAKVRELLNIPASATKFTFKQVPDFDVFVQSTSYNRVLLPCTKFLYEVDSSAKAKAPVAMHSEKRSGPPPPRTAGSPIDLAFSFDTTGSMYSCLGEVRKNLETMITRLLKDIPNIRIAVTAHGDYCDNYSSYVTSHQDFSTDKEQLVKFVKDIGGTGGGDEPECYELVLKEVREKLSWRPGSQRALVMIGDAPPHEVKDYPSIKSKYSSIVREAIDWREECDKLLDIGCRIYSVQCGSGNALSDTFWQAIAFKTYGHHLTLKSFTNVFDFIMAIAYKEQGAEQLEAYRQEVIKRTPGGSGLNADLHALFDSLADDEDDNTGAGASSDRKSVLASAGTKRPATSGSSAPTTKKAKTVTPAKATAARKPAVKAKAASGKKDATTAKKTSASTSKARTSARTSTAVSGRGSPKTATAIKKTPTKPAPAKKTATKAASAKKSATKAASAKKSATKAASAKKSATKVKKGKVVAKKATTAKAKSNKGKASTKATSRTAAATKRAAQKKTPVKATKRPASNTSSARGKGSAKRARK